MPEIDPPPRFGPAPRCCDWPGCTEEASFRAPKSRDSLREYRWFCLQHVRDYNKAWDYFAGMSRDDIERHLREDVTWHRPTWRIGGYGPAGGSQSFRFSDPFDVFEGAPPGGGGPFNGNGNGHEAEARSRSTKVERMLARLDLDLAADLGEVKRRYKELVKRHHPDLHGGDRQAEERLKLINEAYTYLTQSGEFA
ncbi:MAG: J domain-containing protein [Geminicoccaceae bacterium]